MALTQLSVPRGRLTLPVRDHRPSSTPRSTVLALHGWPQDGRSWDAVAGHLVAAGHRVCAPDLRGASPQAAPRGRWAYRSGELVADVEAVVQAIGEPVHLLGHDWGAALAWQVAGARPDLVRTLTAVSVPHPAAFIRAMLTSTQALTWWYAGAFQLPLLPELVLGGLARGEARTLRRGLERAGLPAEAARRDAERLADRRLRSGGVNWYRALPFTTPGQGSSRVRVPVLQVWGDADPVVKRRGCERSADWCDAGFELVVLEGVSHFVPEEVPARLAELVLGHVSRSA